MYVYMYCYDNGKKLLLFARSEFIMLSNMTIHLRCDEILSQRRHCIRIELTFGHTDRAYQNVIWLI